MRITIDVTPIGEMLTVDIDPQALKEKIENIRYNYTRYALKDEDACGGQPDKAEDAFWLKMLEERLADIMDRQAKEKGC